MAGVAHRPRWVAVWLVEVAAALQASSAVCSSWEELLEVVWSSGASQKWIWWLGEGSSFFWVVVCEAGSLGWPVALRAKVAPPMAWWRLSEGGSVV